MPELPYFPFYGSDWLGDTKTRRMSPAARGVYIDLLCHAWDAGSIPVDGKERARLAGVSVRTFVGLWQEIAPCWEYDGNGGFIQPRLERERAKQKARRAAGKSGGDAKARA